jgi:hypothetical protein
MTMLKADVVNRDVPGVVYRIKIVLLGTRPPIWRRVLVPADFTLAQLHDVVQVAVGWGNGHLHEFTIGGRTFGEPNPDLFMDGPPCIDELKVILSDVLPSPPGKAKYTYDFGDSWEHAIKVEKILAPEAGVTYPLCTGGERHGPPEDCGGIPGFYNLLEALADPDHPEHEDMQEWIGGFDAEEFSVEAVNQRLRMMFPALRKRKAKRVARRPAATPSMPDLQALVQSLAVELEQSDALRERIRPDDRVSLELSDRERELLLKAFDHEELTSRVRGLPQPDESPTDTFTLDELDELAGHVAAEANHTKDRKLGKELKRLFERIATRLDSFTDEDD